MQRNQLKYNYAMKKLFIIGLIASCAALSSCSITNNATSNLNQVQTSVVLSQNNYKVIGTVSGESKQCYIFGIGGLSKKSLKESAMSNMFKNADLRDGSRAIINVNVVYKNQYYPFWWKAKAIATGTVIEFTK